MEGGIKITDSENPTNHRIFFNDSLLFGPVYMVSSLVKYLLYNDNTFDGFVQQAQK